jgi:hypothetical protein
MLPRPPTGTWRWTSSHGRPGGERGAAARTHAKRRPRSGVETRASRALPTPDHPPPPGRFGPRRPSRSPTTAPRRTRCANRGRPGRTDAFRIQRGADSAAAAGADTGRLSVRTPGSRRWCGHRSPWTPDIGPTSWTDVRPHGGQRTRTQQRTAWPASGHPGRPRRRRPPAERRKASLGLQRLRRSAPHDGSAVPTLAAAVIGQLRSTARHDAAPRRTALLGNGFGVRVERAASLHPLWRYVVEVAGCKP